MQRRDLGGHFPRSFWRGLRRTSFANPGRLDGHRAPVSSIGFNVSASRTNSASRPRTVRHQGGSGRCRGNHRLANAPPGPAERGSEPRTRPRKVHRYFRSSARIGDNARMAHAPSFKSALTRVIERTGGPGGELATLEDAARFVGLLRSWRQGRPHWDFAAELLLRAAETGKRRDVEAATVQM